MALVLVPEVLDGRNRAQRDFALRGAHAVDPRLHEAEEHGVDRVGVLARFALWGRAGQYLDGCERSESRLQKKTRAKARCFHVQN